MKYFVFKSVILLCMGVLKSSLKCARGMFLNVLLADWLFNILGSQMREGDFMKPYTHTQTQQIYSMNSRH